MADVRAGPTEGGVPAWATEYDASRFDAFSWTADVVGFALDPEAGSLHALLVVRGNEPFRGLHAWPGGFVDAASDRDSLAAAWRELREETSQGDVAHVEELGTYGRMGRDPRQFAGRVDPETGEWTVRGRRVVTTAHLALVRKEGRTLAAGEGEDAADALWGDVYDFLPWEDRRGVEGRTACASAVTALRAWAREDASGERTARVDRAFGAEGGRWNEELVPARYALLAEAGLVEEAHRDVWGRVDGAAATLPTCGRPMAFDHREIMADALGRLRGKLKYVPRVLHALVEDHFTLDDLQGACEAVAGRPLHRANFRRMLTSRRTPLVESTGRRRETQGPGVDPELFSLRAEAVASRLDVSLRMPWTSLT